MQTQNHSALNEQTTLHSASKRTFYAPTAGGKKGRCFYNHHGASQGCGAETLDGLNKVATRQRLVVLHNPCGAHGNMLIPSLKAMLTNVTLNEFSRKPGYLWPHRETSSTHVRVLPCHMVVWRMVCVQLPFARHSQVAATLSYDSHG